MSRIISIVLGGGKGTRLFPLTEQRAKPAVPFGGKYRLVDIAISNCINSGLRQIYILTQFNSASLHNHLSSTYIFDVFSKGFVEILAAEQTPEHSSWYQGTADAVRKNFLHFHTQNPTHYVILSGDQLYRMDLRRMLDHHIQSGAEITIASTPVTHEDTSALGILRTDNKSHIVDFLEKPAKDLNIDEYRIPADTPDIDKNIIAEKPFLASMGMYIFNASVLEGLLDNSFTDFGKEIIPMSIKSKNVSAYVYTGFWEDIGTIKNFYETNIDLASLNPRFNFYDETMPIYTHRRHLPATKVNFCNISQSLTAEGSIITNANITNSIIGIRSIIESGASLDGVYNMGAQQYETPAEKAENMELGRPNIGIGKGTQIRKAIIDIDARIGEGCRIGIDHIQREDGDFGSYAIRDGIIVIRKEAVIQSGTVI